MNQDRSSFFPPPTTLVRAAPRRDAGALICRNYERLLAKIKGAPDSGYGSCFLYAEQQTTTAASSFVLRHVIMPSYALADHIVAGSPFYPNILSGRMPNLGAIWRLRSTTISFLINALDSKPGTGYLVVLLSASFLRPGALVHLIFGRRPNGFPHVLIQLLILSNLGLFSSHYWVGCKRVYCEPLIERNEQFFSDGK